MYSAVKECYESLKNILEILIIGNMEKRYSRHLLIKLNSISITLDVDSG